MRVREQGSELLVDDRATVDRWLGPFRRPRNAMVELEREATVLRNRHGEDVRIGDEVSHE